MRTRWLCLLVLAMLTIGACNDDGDDQGAGTTTSAPPATTTTTAPPETTTTAPPETTTTTEQVCDAGDMPANAVAVTEAPGDFDGDGAADNLIAYGAGDPSPWHLRIELASGESVDVEIPDAVDPGTVQALGGAEISASVGLPPDGSGVEAFATVGSGASVSLVGVFQLTGCDLARLNGPDGNPSAFPVGGAVTHGGGLRCEGISGGQRLIQLAAESPDGVTYSTTETLLKVEGGALVQGNPPILGQLTSPGDDDAIQGFYSIRCTGVSSP